MIANSLSSLMQPIVTAVVLCVRYQTRPNSTLYVYVYSKRVCVSTKKPIQRDEKVGRRIHSEIIRTGK